MLALIPLGILLPYTLSTHCIQFPTPSFSSNTPSLDSLSLHLDSTSCTPFSIPCYSHTLTRHVFLPLTFPSLFQLQTLHSIQIPHSWTSLHLLHTSHTPTTYAPLQCPSIPPHFARPTLPSIHYTALLKPSHLHTRCFAPIPCPFPFFLSSTSPTYALPQLIPLDHPTSSSIHPSAQPMPTPSPISTLTPSTHITPNLFPTSYMKFPLPSKVHSPT